MIQELLGGGAGLIGGERKISISGVLEGSPSPSLSPSPSPSSTTASAVTTTTTTSETQNLRCPRCDSSNTKFCYYNNYNLTQPRHFCKTCRRYWTKGGALRNVPIGGGCRKNKNICSVTTTTTTSPGKSSGGVGVGVGRLLKTNTFSSPSDHNQMGKSSGLFEEMIPSNPIMWASPQSSHLLAFLRANQNSNPNPNPNLISSNSVNVKEESVMIGSHMNLNPFNQFPNSMSLCSSSPFWRSNQQQAALQQQNQFVVGGGGGGEVQNTGSFQDMYQRMRSTTSPANYYLDHHHHQSPVLLSNVGSSSLSSSSSPILESAPVASSEMNYWNTTLPWTDLPTTTNGAYPN